MSKLELAPKEKMPEVKTVLLNVYNNDKKTRIRAKALFLLNKNFSADSDIMPLNEKALMEVSYAINGEALEAISKINPKLAMEKAKQFEGENAKDVIFPIAELYANHGADDQINFFQNSLKYMNGFEIVSFCNYYAKTAKRCNLPASSIIAAKDLESFAKGSNRFTKYGALKGLRDISVAWEAKEKAAKLKLDAAKSENKSSADLEKDYNTINETKDILLKMYNGVK